MIQATCFNNMAGCKSAEPCPQGLDRDRKKTVATPIPLPEDPAWYGDRH